MNIKTTDIIIVIPIYKAHLTEEEYISINQCIRVLHNYTIRFVGPVSIEHIGGFEIFLSNILIMNIFKVLILITT